MLDIKGPRLAEHLISWGYERVRFLGDGFPMGVVRMAGRNWRLHFGFDYSGPWENYCYHSREAAMRALEEFDPDVDQEPTGWVKHIETNRCRVDGDPHQESIGWPVPQARTAAPPTSL